MASQHGVGWWYNFSKNYVYLLVLKGNKTNHQQL